MGPITGRPHASRLMSVTLLAAGLLVAAACGATNPASGSNNNNNNTDNGQTWLVTFRDSMHEQTVKVYIAPYTYGSTWGEVSGSNGLYMFGPDGVCRYRMMVGGNSVHDSPYDRFSCVNLGGSGCGMQTIGRCEFTVNGHYPDITEGDGTYTLTTQNAGGGSVTGTARITAKRQ